MQKRKKNTISVLLAACTCLWCHLVQHFSMYKRNRNHLFTSGSSNGFNNRRTFHFTIECILSIGVVHRILVQLSYFASVLLPRLLLLLLMSSSLSCFVFQCFLPTLFCRFIISRLPINKRIALFFFGLLFVAKHYLPFE